MTNAIKVSFAMVFKDNEDILKKIAPKIPGDMFWNYIFLDTGSTDKSREIISQSVRDPIFIEDKENLLAFGTWRNLMMAKAKEEGCDWIVMIDTDETMFREDYWTLFKYMEKGKHTLYRMARINLVRDEQHYAPRFYPDWQARALKLSAGFYYDTRLHAEPMLNGQIAQGLYLPNVTLYHYSWTKPPHLQWLKDENYRRTVLKIPILDKVPANFVPNMKYYEGISEEFFGPVP